MQAFNAFCPALAEETIGKDQLNSSEFIAATVFGLIPRSTTVEDPVPVPDAGREPWLLIPPWLAGTWRAREQTILQAYSYSERRQTVTEPLKIAIDRVSRIGVQRDKDGGIWHYTGIPYIRSIETPSYVVTQHMDYRML